MLASTIVPVDVIGPPERPVPVATLVKVPVVAEQVGQVRLPVVALSTSGELAPTAKVPVVFGSVSVGVPAAA